MTEVLVEFVLKHIVCRRDERSFSVCGCIYRNEGALHWLRIRSLRQDPLPSALKFAAALLPVSVLRNLFLVT